jgi:phosphoribosyl-ATP pyrophosphohydrolase
VRIKSISATATLTHYTKEEVGEELSDLWYLTTVASHYALRLDDVVRDNLEKTAARFATGEAA